MKTHSGGSLLYLVYTQTSSDKRLTNLMPHSNAVGHQQTCKYSAWNSGTTGAAGRTVHSQNTHTKTRSLSFQGITTPPKDRSSKHGSNRSSKAYGPYGPLRMEIHTIIIWYLPFPRLCALECLWSWDYCCPVNELKSVHVSAAICGNVNR